MRQRSKFGCVNCRSAIYEYEHIQPVFAEAKTHDPDFICLLCGRCHGLVTKRHLSKETVLKKYRITERDPHIKRPFGEIDIQENGFSIYMGNNLFLNSSSIISIDDIDILRLDPPEDDGGPPLLSGVFFDHNGKEIFRIEKNVWHGPLDAWDMDIVGNKITIRTQKRKIGLEILLQPPNSIIINRVEMNFMDINILIDDAIKITREEYNMKRTTTISKYTISGSSSCVHLKTKEYVKINTEKITYHAQRDGERLFLGRGAQSVKVGSYSSQSEPLST